MPPSEPAGKVQGENSIVNSWYFWQPEMIFLDTQRSQPSVVIIGPGMLNIRPGGQKLAR